MDPLMVGFLIFVGWFLLFWASTSFLTDRCGMVEKFAYPCALVIAAAAATLAIFLCFGKNWAGWIALLTAFIYVCLRLSGED